MYSPAKSPATAIDDTWCNVAFSRLRQLDDGAGALDVGGPLLGLAGGDVVDRRAMHHVVDLAQLGDGLVGQLEFREVGDQWFYPFVPVHGPAFETPQRLAANQHPHLRVRLGVH